MKKTYCDKCKKEIDKEHYIDIELKIKGTHKGWNDGEYQYEGDLCEEHLNELHTKVFNTIKEYGIAW